MAEIQHLLLAAGNSSRMGRPKQMLPWGNQTLIGHQIQTLLQTGNPVNVVLGSHSDMVIPLIEKYTVNVFINTGWENGMGSSVAFGVNKLLKKNRAMEGVLISLLDQPLVTATHLKKMLNAFRPGNRQIIVSQSSSGWEGAPVLFDKTYFNELKKLKGKEGAKTIIQQYKNDAISINCGEILEDMDTPESYQRMLKKTHM